MEKGLFHDLYKRLGMLDLRSYPPARLSGLLHGYLTVYSMVRVYPWLENDFGTPGDIHERAKSIVHLYPGQLNGDVSVDTRAGYAADKMDVYQVYSDLSYLKNGLDAAYRILSARGNGKISLPCRTPNICRLLCNCYYFAGDDECGELAGRLVTEALGYTRGSSSDVLLPWWDSICLYSDVVGTMELPEGERERLGEERVRLDVRVKQLEDEKIKQLHHAESEGDIGLLGDIFKILAKREMEKIFHISNSH
ncbi:MULTISPECIES: hypothetical protein [unclassified Butyricimonas]|uniref:hypothetical protein n=1 Tax=unclassified Butyricimonas TaxID=2637652 RepID=UPI000C08B9D3|nr:MULTISPECIES: hypothetical protein [unclassified Butyricimonas]